MKITPKILDEQKPVSHLTTTGFWVKKMAPSKKRLWLYPSQCCPTEHSALTGQFGYSSS